MTYAAADSTGATSEGSRPDCLAYPSMAERPHAVTGGQAQSVGCVCRADDRAEGHAGRPQAVGRSGNWCDHWGSGEVRLNLVPSSAATQPLIGWRADSGFAASAEAGREFDKLATDLTTPRDSLTREVNLVVSLSRTPPV